MSKRLLLVVLALCALALPAVLAVRAQQDPGSSDSNPAGEPEVVIPERYAVRDVAAAEDATTLYFTPQDENTSTTVLFLYNTGTMTQTTTIETFRLDGTPYLEADINVPAGHLVRIAGDAVDPIGTWTDVVLVNFTTSSTYGRLTMPEGVKATGYVAWNGNGPYDPLVAVPVLDLRFSIDPPTIFLPVSTAD